MASKVARLLRNLNRLGIIPNTLHYYKDAFSIPDVNTRGYQRLEFLGDSVLGMIIAEWCYHSFPNAQEGELSLARSSLVSQGTLMDLANSLDLAAFFPDDHELTDNQLSDLVESLIGAYYLDHGFHETKLFVTKLLSKYCDQLLSQYHKDPQYLRSLRSDPISRLQILTQRLTGSVPEYVVTQMNGAPHERVFTIRVNVTLGDTVFSCEATGHSKKEAKKTAAIKLLKEVEPILELRKTMIRDVLSDSENPLQALTLLSQQLKITPPRFLVLEETKKECKVQASFRLFGVEYKSIGVASNLHDAKLLACQDIIHAFQHDYALQPVNLSELKKWKQVLKTKNPLHFLFWLSKHFSFPDPSFSCSELPSGEIHCSLTFFTPQGELYSQAIGSSKTKAKTRAAKLLMNKPEFQEFMEEYLEQLSDNFSPPQNES